jgi:hypothetical protein
VSSGAQRKRSQNRRSAGVVTCKDTGDGIRLGMDQGMEGGYERLDAVLAEPA